MLFHPGPLRSYDDVLQTDRARFARWHRGLLERGIYWPASQFEAAFISAAHSEANIDWTVEAARAALSAC